MFVSIMIILIGGKLEEKVFLFIVFRYILSVCGLYVVFFLRIIICLL